MKIDKNTWPALELLKAISIACMIVLHSWGMVITEEDFNVYKGSWFLIFGNILHFGCFFDIWIPAIAGATLNLQLLKQNYSSPTRLSVVKNSSYWGFILLLSGWVFEIFLRNPYPFLSFNPLHFMGGSFLIVTVLLAISKNNDLTLWTLVFFIVALFKDSITSLFPYVFPETYEELFRHGALEVTKFYLAQITFGISSQGWSLIPWFSIVLIGFSYSNYYSKNILTPKTLKAMIFISLFIVLFFLAFKSSRNFIQSQTLLDQYSALNMPIPLFISCASGFIFILSALTYFQKKLTFVHQPFPNAFSRGSFWIFFLHFPLGNVLSSLFESYSFGVRWIGFPIFMLAWCFLIGLIILELGKKKINIKLLKLTPS